MFQAICIQVTNEPGRVFERPGSSLRENLAQCHANKLQLVSNVQPVCLKLQTQAQARQSTRQKPATMGSHKRASGLSNTRLGSFVSQAATKWSHTNEESVQKTVLIALIWCYKRWSLVVMVRRSLCEGRLNIKKRKKQSVPGKMVVVVRWSFYGRSFWPGGTVDFFCNKQIFCISRVNLKIYLCYKQIWVDLSRKQISISSKQTRLCISILLAGQVELASLQYKLYKV